MITQLGVNLLVKFVMLILHLGSWSSYKKLCLLERYHICTSTSMCTKLGEGEQRDRQIEVAETSDVSISIMLYSLILFEMTYFAFSNLDSNLGAMDFRKMTNNY
jgi:hypothetical protein